MTEPLPHPAGPDPIRVRQLFREAFSLPPAQRDRIVRQRANGDEALAREVLELLRAAALGATADLQAAGQAGLDQARAAGAPSNDGPSTATDELLGRLAAAPRLDSDRYEIEGDAGGGGMGAILCLHDRHLNRRVAMKVPFDRLVLDAEDQRLARDLLGRFLAEAQVTSQLDHPGVVPVHDIGLDQNGRVYFTMRLVQGRTADQVFADAKAQRDGWTTTRALEVLLKVCDTTAFAHARGVLHRDLKPANVMVGAYGEVYVLDWGLAKVSGTPERTGTALRPTLATTRQQDNHGATHPGARMGTPSYMSPEQARGELVDERTDVYAIGAMLYELLAGSAPFATLGLGPQQIVEKVATASAGDLEALDRSIPAELVAITERAMARERDRRYAAVADLAADLRAFLDQRAVRAYRTGALVELRLWMRRNKALAASLAAAVAILIAGVLGTSAYAAEAKRNEIQAKQEGARADAKVREFDLLSGVVLYERAIANEAELYPPWPHKIAAMETWLREDAGKLLEMRPEIERTIRDLEARALPPTDEERATGRSHPRFMSESNRFLHSTLLQLRESLKSLEANEKPAVEQRLSWARQVRDLTMAHPNARHTWNEVRAAISENPKYAGQEIELRDDDVLGLVPIGENPVTRLWEFYELRSAWDSASDPHNIPIPQHEADGTIRISDATGIVLALVPGGTFQMGSDTSDPSSIEAERPPHMLSLSPFFIARHEVSRGQWLRLGGPSCFWWDNGAAYDGDPRAVDASYPADSMSWKMQPFGARNPASPCQLRLSGNTHVELDRPRHGGRAPRSRIYVDQTTCGMRATSEQ
ncbi:MAG: protein kinase [Planctomycetes bacterium]|nr:protein kinase [Planctomycetota bacterium]